MNVAPPRVSNPETYWREPPPEPSARLEYWLRRVEAGWKPNKRIRALGYHASSFYFGVYIWEWQNVLRDRLYGPRTAPVVELRIEHDESGGG